MVPQGVVRIVSEPVLHSTRRYDDPPDEPYPGRPAAPRFIPEGQAAAEVAVLTVPATPAPQQLCPSCQTELVSGYCNRCGHHNPDRPSDDALRRMERTAGHINTQGRFQRSVDSVYSASHRRRITSYITQFVRVAMLRFLILLLDDMPQALLSVLYITSVDSDSGLYCQNCAAIGDGACAISAGAGADMTAVYLKTAGTLVSVFVLFMQVLYAEKFARATYHEGALNPFGVELAICILLIPCLLAPILTAALGTGLGDVVGWSHDTEVAIIVIVCICWIPWSVVAWLLLASLAVAFDFLCPGDCLGADCVDCGGADGCCCCDGCDGIFDCCDVCCCC